MATETLTGYGVHKLANARLKAANLKTIEPQMVYSYLDKMIPTVLVDGQKRVTREVAEAWVEKFVANRIRRANEQVETTEVAPTETEEV